MRTTWIRAMMLTALVMALATLRTPVATAATIESGSECVIAAGDTHEGNLYAFCDTVRVDGTLDGDLVTAASIIEVGEGGRVTGSILAAAQGVSVGGQVDGSVRAAAFTIQVDDGGAIGDDLAAAGFSIGVAEKATIGGSVLGAGYQGIIDGDVTGDLWFSGSGLEVTGTVEGDVQATVDAPSSGGVPSLSMFPFIQVKPERVISPGLKVADTAEIGGRLEYNSPSPVTIPPAAVAGTIVFNEPEVEEDATEEEAVEAERSPIVGWLIGLVKSFAALLIFAMAFAFLLPSVRAAAAEYVTMHTVTGFGWGVGTAAVALLLLLLVPVIALALLAIIALLRISPLALPVVAATLLTISVASLGLYLLSWAARVTVADWIGGTILRRIAPTMAGNRFVPMILGLAVFALLVSIPYIGFVLKLILVFVGIGGLVASMWRAWTNRHADPMISEQPA